MNRKTFVVLIVIYIAFIALGLPDALLGSGWNLIREDLSLSLGTLGFMTFTVYIMSFISTYNAPRLLRLLETKKITFISIAFTGLALISISFLNQFYQFLFFAIPLGIGAGAIDVSLNNYLTKNYKAHHMNYLHSFYGIGVTMGPTIMAYTLFQNSWRLGYQIVGLILLGIATIVFISFALWKKETVEERETEHYHISLKTIFSNKKTLKSISIFLLYVHLESLTGIWIASYFFITKEVSYGIAALFTTAYYLSFTIGRFLSGILSHKIHSRHLVLVGEILIITSAVLLILNNVDNLVVYFIITAILGLGCAPVYPNMMYLNKEQFPKEQISKVISLQMAIGYIGFGIFTPLAGLLFDKISIDIYPYLVLIIGVIITMLTYNYLFRNKEIETTI